MGLFGPFIYKTKSGQQYFLHLKEKGKVKLYYFSKESLDSLSGIPHGYDVIENERTGLPLLRKAEKKEKKDKKGAQEQKS